LDRAVAENRKSIIRCVRDADAARVSSPWDEVIFQFGEGAFLHVDSTMVTGYAETYEEAERLILDFVGSYGQKKPAGAGSFQLLRLENFDQIQCENVMLEAEAVLSDEAFALHYPHGTAQWHRTFVENLVHRKSGLAILEGSPGTGKTSYLRHLMGQLKQSHRFYFIPPTSRSIVADPEFIGFWSKQRKRYPSLKLVVILEDADAALMTRDSDNREQVTAILNLSDGMMADFLHLQIICTMNCSASDIDQALLRPGRLITHRVFQRFDVNQANALAASLGKTLRPAPDYSLAEVFTDEESEAVPRPRLGFAA
jgi:hypothetical protein